MNVHCLCVCCVQMTALHWSAYNNSAENVKLLLKAVSFSLFLLCWCDRWFLLSAQGADIVLSDSDGKSAIHWTANNQDNSTVKTLLVS